MMNKKLTIAATAVIACIGAVAIGFPVRADQSKSQGNIVFQEGEMALYASDIDYLTSELDSLFAEIPDEDKTLSDSESFDYVRKENIQSKGIIDYAGGTVVINSADLIYLANEIDLLENTYKQIILKYLNGINTYMTADGSVTHDIDSSDDSYFPTFGDLINGISLSQEVETETTIDNLAKDKGAWVNGEYIVGTGKDIDDAYTKGYDDGGKDRINHLYEGVATAEGYQAYACNCQVSLDADGLWGEKSDNMNVTLKIPIENDNEQMLYSISFVAGYRAASNYNGGNDATSSGSYSLYTQEGDVLQSQAFTAQYSTDGPNTPVAYSNIYIDLFSKSFSTEDDYLYLDLNGNVHTRITSATVDYSSAIANYSYTGITANYK